MDRFSHTILEKYTEYSMNGGEFLSISGRCQTVSYISVGTGKLLQHSHIIKNRPVILKARALQQPPAQDAETTYTLDQNCI